MPIFGFYTKIKVKIYQSLDFYTSLQIILIYTKTSVDKSEE